MPGNTPPKILIVDDDDALRAAMALMLERVGMKVCRTASGKEALEEAKNLQPDLVLLDLNLPDENGFDVCEKLRELYPQDFLPILILTGDDTYFDKRARGFKAGAYDFLFKPIGSEELLARVNSFLQMRRLYITVERQKKQLAAINQVQESTINKQKLQMDMLRRFFSPQVSELMLSVGGQEILTNHRREITVVFFDLRGFTAFAEAVSPMIMIDVLSEYYRVVCRLALAYDGTISSLAGDGIMVFFNDPVLIERHTEAAVRFALEVRRQLQLCEEGWRIKGYNLGFAAGMARGESTIGAVGFDQFVHYTAISSSVNLASRLCSEADVGQILSTMPCLREVENSVKLDSLGTRNLRGINVPLKVFNILEIS